MIGGGERNELGARNFSGEDAAFFGRGDAVSIGVKNDSGNGDGREKMADVDVVASAHGLDEIIRRDGDDLEIIEPALVFVGGFFRDVEVCDDLEERGVSFAPVELDERFKRAANFDGVGMATVVRTTRISPA